MHGVTKPQNQQKRHGWSEPGDDVNALLRLHGGSGPLDQANNQGSRRGPHNHRMNELDGKIGHYERMIAENEQQLATINLNQEKRGQ